MFGRRTKKLAKKKKLFPCRLNAEKVTKELIIIGDFVMTFFFLCHWLQKTSFTVDRCNRKYFFLSQTKKTFCDAASSKTLRNDAKINSTLPTRHANSQLHSSNMLNRLPIFLCSRGKEFFSGAKCFLSDTHTDAEDDGRLERLEVFDFWFSVNFAALDCGRCFEGWIYFSILVLTFSMLILNFK